MSKYSDIDQYLSGDKLYGEDLSEPEIISWFQDELEGFSGLSDDSGERYPYHALDKAHAYRRLPVSTRFGKVLGIGSGYGFEFLPIIGRTDEIFIVEASTKLRSQSLCGKVIHYREPHHSGTLPFEDKTFDLITALSVLHHIPNVSAVVAEMFRVCKPGGYILIREPIISMGDWREKRQGLTPHERGIPLGVLQRIVDDLGLEIVDSSFCVFSLLGRIGRSLDVDVFNNSVIVLLDSFLSKLTKPLYRYHAVHWWQKIRPTACYWILKRL